MRLVDYRRGRIDSSFLTLLTKPLNGKLQVAGPLTINCVTPHAAAAIGDRPVMADGNPSCPCPHATNHQLCHTTLQEKGAVDILKKQREACETYYRRLFAALATMENAAVVEYCHPIEDTADVRCSLCIDSATTP
jgi:hypothetical protein